MLFDRKELIDSAQRKPLTKSEKTSLIKTIKSFNDLGKDAYDWITKNHVNTNILVAFMYLLKDQGVDIIWYRETGRYTKITALTIQQRWQKELGKILRNTTFINCKSIKTLAAEHIDPEGEIINCISWISPEQAARIILSTKKDGEAKPKSIAFYRSGDEFLIAEIYKNKKTEVTHFFGSFRGSRISDSPIKVDSNINKEVEDVEDSLIFNIDTETRDLFCSFYDENQKQVANESSIDHIDFNDFDDSI